MVLIASALLVISVAGSLILATRPNVVAELENEVNAMPTGMLKRGALALLGWFGSVTAASAQALPPAPATVLGINPAGIRYWSSTVPFANLVTGSGWMDSHWRPMTADHVDANGAIRSLPADGTAYRFLLTPPTGPGGIDVRCTFTGSGTLSISGLDGPIQPGSHSLRFRLVNQRGKQPRPWLIVTGVKAGQPLRDLDCRESRVTSAVRFRSEFVDTLRGFGVVRFMDWQEANANEAVRWSERRTPVGIDLYRDGVSIEDMLALTRELGADPWFVMPWNADDEYITRFAEMVRAQLPARRSVYVEVGNEVWNGGFSVGKQAAAEGLARGFGPDINEAKIRRYAERTTAVMRLWEAAFAGRGGLVRVLATQHVWPHTAEIALSFRDTASHVDALATAPYFGEIVGGFDSTRESSLATLAKALNASMKTAAENRRIASRFGKRYVAYEGGQGLVLPAQVDLSTRLQHDPAMYDLYREYLAAWRHDMGDVLCLFDSVSQPNAWGMWGLAAWEDETTAEAPKLRAVRESLNQSSR